MTTPKHISVCICTFRRPSLLRKLLDRLEHQNSNGQFSFSIVVTDNDFWAKLSERGGRLCGFEPDRGEIQL